MVRFSVLKQLLDFSVLNLTDAMDFLQQDSGNTTSSGLYYIKTYTSSHFIVRVSNIPNLE